MADGSIVSWDASGGIATKNAPLMIQPGSALRIDNARQERKNEWRTRPGNTRNELDDLPGANVPVMLTQGPWGGFVGLCRQTNDDTAGRVYAQSAGTRWVSPVKSATYGEACAQTTPGVWTRNPVGPVPHGNSGPSGTSTAQGEGYRITAWWTLNTGAGTGIQVAIQSIDGATVEAYSQISLGQSPKCVYSSAAQMLILSFVDNAANVQIMCWSALTGAFVQQQTISAAAFAATANVYLDAIYYGGTTVTIAFRNNVATGNVSIAEYNPSTNAVTVYPQLVDCSLALALFQDPDASGIRMVGVGTVTPETRVLRLSSTGVLVTNQLVEAVNCYAIAGVAYNGGVDWMAVYTVAGITDLRAVKHRSGVISAAVNIVAAARMKCGLATAAWREPNTDAMRYMIRADGLAADDDQSTFLEMALEFENGAATISNQWTEPQARLLVLNAAVPVLAVRSSLGHAQRLGTDNFLVSLARVTQSTITDLQAKSLYAVDAWTVQYLGSTTRTSQNVGQGTLTQQDAFLPAGNLLHTSTGQLLCAHGASSIPFKPTLVASAGAGGLDPAKTYVYGVTVWMPDENGNAWRSPMSVMASVLPGGANNTVTASGTLTPLENRQRRRIVLLWRTDGDGTTFKLLTMIDSTVPLTDAWTYVDDTGDVGDGQEYEFALPGTIGGELEAGITPALSHVTSWNGRLWGIDRDFSTRVRYSKPLSAGLLPEFPDDFVIDIDDAFGPGTGLAAMDDKIVLLKGSAIYVAGGDGPENDGSGQGYQFQLISQESGSIVGSPVLATGSEVYMMSLGGLVSLGRSQEVAFAGAAIDLYLSMPLLESPETVTGMVLSSSLNEVRVQTTNYRFVYDRVFGTWARDTGGMGSGIVMTRMLGNRQALFLSSGQMWIEDDDSTTPSDADTAFSGAVRAPWMRPANMEGWIRLRHLRALGECTASSGATAQPQIAIYFDNDDTIVELFNPRYTVAALEGPIRADCKPRKELCTAFSPQLTLPEGNATVRFDSWSALVSVEQTMQALTNRDNWLPVITAPAEPPPPPIPEPSPIPVTSRDYVIAKLTGQQLGGLRLNQIDTTIQVKNAWVASGVWSVLRSSNGVSVTATDQWTTAAAVGVGSWIQLENAFYGWQLMIAATVVGGWFEVVLRISPTAGFTGGTAVVPPTATDSVIVNTFGVFMGTGPVGDPQFKAFTWNSTDGAVTRATFYYAGQLTGLWEISLVSSPASGWEPVQGTWWSGGNNYTAPSARLSLNIFRVQAEIKARTASGNVENFTRTPEIGLFNFPIVDAYGTNETTGQYLWSWPLGLQVGNLAAPRNGSWGWLTDQWWGPSVGFPSFVPLMAEGSTINGGGLIVVGQMFLPWDGTLNPPNGGPPTTDYPTTQFYGRNAANTT